MSTPNLLKKILSLKSRTEGAGLTIFVWIHFRSRFNFKFRYIGIIRVPLQCHNRQERENLAASRPETTKSCPSRWKELFMTTPIIPDFDYSHQKPQELDGTFCGNNIIWSCLLLQLYGTTPKFNHRWWFCKYSVNSVRIFSIQQMDWIRISTASDNP